MSVLLGNGDGSFEAAEPYASGGVGEVESLSVADLNHDNKPDLIVANACLKKNVCNTGSVGVLLNRMP